MSEDFTVICDDCGKEIKGATMPVALERLGKHRDKKH